ncbi:MAG TPA: iron-sulfur cluster repair protein YtfE [Kofleriaceae bacterium]|nr:iron-sulfur cluster repair protein YtfE [Kofleriaceae bacterium]
MSLGDLAREHPCTTRVFLRYHLDFCCGGRRTLAEACQRAGLDPTRIASELEEAVQRDEASQTEQGPVWTKWDEQPLGELADHIEHHYHAALRRDLPPLIEAARKVERVHADKSAVPSGLAAVLSAFFAEMQSHMAKEENILFPMIRRGARGEAVYMPVRMMESEHDAHRQHLARIRELTRDLAVPAEACATWRALYRGLETLEAELMQHIHLENNILFLRATRDA